MEAQKIINLLEESDDDDLKFQARKWRIINNQNNGQCGKGYENDSTIKFTTEVVKPNVCGYSDAYILVKGNIAVVNGNNNSLVSFKNCSPFTRCVTHVNDEHVETADNVDIIMNFYNLIEHSDSYEQSSGSLWQYKLGLTTRDIATNVNQDIVNSHRLFLKAQIAIPLKYLPY